MAHYAQLRIKAAQRSFGQAQRFRKGTSRVRCVFNAMTQRKGRPDRTAPIACFRVFVRSAVTVSQHADVGADPPFGRLVPPAAVAESWIYVIAMLNAMAVA
jgi:hypothetical protein